MKTIPIVFAIDKNMEMPAGVAITSLLRNAAPESFYDIYILHSIESDFSKSQLFDLLQLYSNCRITLKCVNGEFDGAFEIRGITEAAYYRLLIPELIPQYEKILYSDVDVIFRDDLSKYLDINLDNYYFGAVDHSHYLDKNSHKYMLKHGIDISNGYYNSGELVFNSHQLRKDNLIPQFKQHGLKKYRFQDQDIINIVCCGKIKPLPVSFNLTNYLYFSLVGQGDSICGYSDMDKNYALSKGTVHYNGAKPWKEVCMNMDIWWDYYRKSIFFDEKFAHDFWYGQTYRIEKMSLWKRIKQVARYFRKGGRM